MIDNKSEWYGKKNEYCEPMNTRGGLKYGSVHKGTTWKTERFAERRHQEFMEIIKTFGRTYNGGSITPEIEYFLVFRIFSDNQLTVKNT